MYSRVLSRGTLFKVFDVRRTLSCTPVFEIESRFVAIAQLSEELGGDCLKLKAGGRRALCDE